MYTRTTRTKERKYVEKYYQKYYQLRISLFLLHLNACGCLWTEDAIAHPLMYQYLADRALIEKTFAVEGLTYEEANALRYVAGYVCFCVSRLCGCVFQGYVCFKVRKSIVASG